MVDISDQAELRAAVDDLYSHLVRTDFEFFVVPEKKI